MPPWAMRALEQRHDLLGVAGKRAADVAAAHLDGERAAVDGRHLVDVAALLHGALVGRRRELAFGQPVAAVVLDDVENGHVAPDHVQEVAEPDRRSVAVAAHADVDELAVGELRRPPRSPPCARARR